MNTPLIALTPTDYFGAQKGDTKFYSSLTEAMTEVARLVSYPDTKVALYNTVLTADGQWDAEKYAFAQVSSEGWYALAGRAREHAYECPTCHEDYPNQMTLRVHESLSHAKEAS